MAQLALAVTGAAIGAAIGGPLGISWGAQAGFAAGAIVGGYLFAPRPQVPDQFGPRLGDRAVQSSAYGAAIGIVRGTMRTAGNVIWATPIAEHAFTTVQEVGGGGGGKGGHKVTQSQTTYTYSVSFAVGFCEGVKAGVQRIWADTKLIYDARPGYSAGPISDCASVREVRFYPGDALQTADALIVADKGSNTPAFRDLCYLVFDDMALENYGNRVPSISVELVEVVDDDVRIGYASGPIVRPDGSAYNPGAEGFGGFRTRFPLGGIGDFDQEIVVDGGEDVNVYTLAGEPSEAKRFLVHVTDDVTHLMMGGPWPEGSEFVMLNEAVIVGRGGDGGGVEESGPQDGDDGEDALELAGLSITIDNSGGYIFGGAGGGGSGGAAIVGAGDLGYSLGEVATGGYGGGGPGGGTSHGGTSSPGPLAIVQYDDSSGHGELANSVGTIFPGAVGGSLSIDQVGTFGGDGGRDGLTPIVGTGGAPSITSSTGWGLSITAGAGGDGGSDFGEDGEDGEESSCTGETVMQLPPGSGGAAGKAIALQGGSVTWLAGNDASRVKGAVA